MKTLDEWKQKFQIGTQFKQIWRFDKGEVEFLCTVSKVQTDGIWASCPGFSDGFMPFAIESSTILFTEKGWIRLDQCESKLSEYVWVEEYVIWGKEKIIFSPTFLLLDPKNEKRDQVAKDIERHLDFNFDESIYDHISFIIECLEISFSLREELAQPVKDTYEIVKVTCSLHKYLDQWVKDIASKDYGPNYEECEKAAQDTLLITMRYIYPKWVTIEKR